jgi:hypothetical protein
MALVHPLSVTELQNLPAAVDLVTAGRAVGIGRTKSYELARAGEFPVPVLRLGNSYRVTRADLLRLLGESRGDERDGTRQSVAPAPDEQPEPLRRRHAAFDGY